VRVGIDIKNLSLAKGGIGTFVRAVLPSLVSRNPNVEFVAIGPAEAQSELAGSMHRATLEICQWLGPARLPVYDQWQLRRVVKRERVDVFFSPYFDAPVGMNIPTVVMMMDAVHLRYPELYPWRQRVYYQNLMRLHGSSSAAVITISEFSKKELVELAGINPLKVHVVYLALPLLFSLALSGTAEHRLTNRYQVPRDYVLYTGGVEARKNIRGLLRAYIAWQELRRDIPPLVLTGDPTRYGLYRDDLERLGIGRGVYLVGRITEGDLPQIYARARAVIYPSLYEGFGYPLLEAMASGVPIACSRRASLPEIGSDAALYFEPDETDDIIAALEAVTENQHLRADLIAKGTTRLRDFTLDKTTSGIERVILGAAGTLP